MVTTNLYGIYVGGNRRDAVSKIEIRANSMSAAKKIAREWLGDASGEIKISAQLLIAGYTFHADRPPISHRLYQSAA